MGRRAAEPRTWPPLIEEFREHLEYERNRSPLTARGYCGDLLAFASHLILRAGGVASDEAMDAALRGVTASQVRLYAMGLLERAGEGLPTASPEHTKARTRAARRVGRILAALHSFFGWEKRTGARDDDPTADVARPNPGKTDPHVLQERSVRRLLDTSIAGRLEWLALRDNAILRLFYATGVRISELVGLDVAHVDLRLKQARIHGKGNKDRTVVLTTPAVEALARYMEHRPNVASPALFLSRENRRISIRHTRTIYAQYKTISGIEEPASPHTMRHSMATHLVEHGADLMSVKDQLGHESLSTTGQYLHLATEARRRIIEAAHPDEIDRLSTHSDEPQQEF